MTPEEGDEVGKKVAEQKAAEAAPTEAAAPATDAAEAAEAGVAGGGEAAPAPEVDLAQTVIDLEDELQKTKDRLLRNAADFENYRKRAQREQEEARVRGREEILRELIGVYDNLERALDAARAHGEQASAASALIDGVAMVQRQFLDGLGKFGLKQFSAIGTPFDPAFHEAMAQQRSETYAPGIVSQEYLKGYMLGERLLRAAMVIVAGPDSTGTPAVGADAGGGAADATGDAKDLGGHEEGSA
jgi:molecular chaperone GrpE